jgi:hypothetical protein
LNKQVQRLLEENRLPYVLKEEEKLGNRIYKGSEIRCNGTERYNKVGKHLVENFLN